MTKSLFLLVSHKFSNENMEATLVCPKCDQVFKKEFPIDLEGQIIGFKCPCAILPVRPIYHTRKLKIEKNLNSISLTSNKKVNEEFEDIY